jgi:hypothetical protein
MNKIQLKQLIREAVEDAKAGAGMTSDTTSGAVQGSTGALETALKGIGVDGESLMKVKKALTNYKKLRKVKPLSTSDKEAMAFVFAAMINTSDDAKLGTVFSALKNLEAKGDKAGKVTESHNLLEGEIQGELEKLGKELAQAVDGDKNIKQSAEKVDEAVGLAIASTILAAPKAVELIGKFLKWAGSKLKSGKLENGGEKVMHMAHAAHSAFLWPLKKILRKIYPKDKVSDKEIEEHANMIFTGITVVLLMFTGMGLADALSKAHMKMAAWESFLSAIKSSEIGGFVAKTVAQSA